MLKHSKILVLFLAFSFVMVLASVAQAQADETVTCPVSGKEIKKSEAKDTFEYKGKTYYFCCPNCKEKFVENPEKYTQKKAETKEVYTCSMHPEVKLDKPGKCPKCGMKLEKKMMHKEKEHEQMMHKEKEHEPMMHKKMMMQMMKMYTHMHKKFGEKACCPEMQMKAKGEFCCPLMGIKDADVKIENLDDGIAVKVTSKNADVVKKIQEMAAKIKTMCSQKEASCKKETEKKEVKK